MLRVSFCVLIEIIYTCIYFRNVRKYTWCIGASISRIHFMTCFKRWRVLFLKKIALSQILPLQDWLNCNCRLYILNYFYWLFTDVHFSHKLEIPYVTVQFYLFDWYVACADPENILGGYWYLSLKGEEGLRYIFGNFVM